MDHRLQNCLSKCTTIHSSPKVYNSFWTQVGIFVLKMSIHYRNLGTHYTLGTQLAAGGNRTDISWHQGLVLQKAKCSKDRREGKGLLRMKAGHTLSSFRSVPHGGTLYMLAGNKRNCHQSAAPSSERGFVVLKHMAACLHALPSTCGERPLII